MVTLPARVKYRTKTSFLSEILSADVSSSLMPYFRSVLWLISNCFRVARVQHSNCLCVDDTCHFLHLCFSNLQSRKTPLFACRSLSDDVSKRHFEAFAFRLGLFNRRAAHGKSAKTFKRAFYQRKTRQGLTSDFFSSDHVDQICVHLASLFDAGFRFLRRNNRHWQESLRRFFLRLQILVQTVSGARENTVDYSSAHSNSILLAHTIVRSFRRNRTFQQRKADNFHDHEDSCNALCSHDIFDFRAAATVKNNYRKLIKFLVLKMRIVGKTQSHTSFTSSFSSIRCVHF